MVTNSQSNNRYKQCALVLESWETAKQRHACPEEIGIAILLELFRFDSSAMEVFGFRNQTVEQLEKSPFLLMGVLVHGGMIVRMLDGVLEMFGPDVESANEILHCCGKRHVKFGVKPSHFGSMNVAVRLALKRTTGNAYSNDVDHAWKEVLGEASKTIIKSMS